MRATNERPKYYHGFGPITEDSARRFAEGIGETALFTRRRLAACVLHLLDTITSLRKDLADLGTAAVDGLLVGKVFTPRPAGEPLPIEQTPLSRKELAPLLEDGPAWDPLISRLLATIEQRDRIYHAIQTTADPAGTVREVVELRDQVGALVRMLEERGGS